MLKLISRSVQDTFDIGERLGKLLEKGNILCLSGDLGAGKTAMTQGIGRGLGVSDYVTSPTYTIINEYQGRLPLYHFDVYRLDHVDEMYELGYEEYFFGDGVTVIEWADSVKDIIPVARLWITILKTKDGEGREILLEPTGEEYIRITEGMEGHEGSGR